jgi:transposase
MRLKARISRVLRNTGLGGKQMRRCPRGSEGIFHGFHSGRRSESGDVVSGDLDELIPEDHVSRVIDAFVGRLDVAGLGFERAEAAETGRPGYDPRDLLKLYLYGYLQQIRSSRRLESECQRKRRVDGVARTIVSRPQEHR